MAKFSSLEGSNTPPLLPINWADWEGDPHVSDMDETMEGIYFRIVKELWKYDQFEFNYTKLASRIRIKDARRVRKFLEVWGHLFTCTKCGGEPKSCWEHAATLPCSCSYCAVDVQCSCSNCAVFVQHDKVKNYKDTAKTGSDGKTKQSNVIEENVSQAKVALGLAPSTTKPVSPVTVQAPVKSGWFDPLTYSEPVVSVKGEKREYSSEDVHKVLAYWFTHPSDTHWKERVNSPPTLALNIDTMHHQMVNAVPADWTPPEPKPPLTRMAGDPACKKCRGRGKVGVLQSDGLTRVTTDCDACEKHQQVAKGREWVDV